MKKIWIVIIALFVISGCTQQESQVKQLDSNQAFQEVSNKQDIIILDVRTISEFDEGHIKNSMNVPIDSIQNTLEDVIEDKNTPIYVVCRTGSRSAQAQSMMLSMGYSDVTDIGSVYDWPEALEITNP